ncbi:hypothetical protein BU108_06285 [Staphylococcus xylosus]|uniref:hypothetical protein n=1 Tax=Staphylococcus xylosus TaxID=1288 RepID=UPI000D1D3415|nr:hypothetical protein [Staphylococcus xylosus]PTH92300.1 hypothetical protein BU108_06285 [Staphylococcus xylosus]
MSTLKEICKEQTEMIDEMRQNIRELTKESKQYKAERDTLIDDIAVLKANISRLERENVKHLKLLKDFSKFINYKLYVSPSNDTYKHYRRELDKLGAK